MANKKKLYTLTDEHRRQLKPHNDRWIKNALRTDPQTADDRETARAAMRGIYRAAKLDPPPREIFCPGPLSAAIAATISSGVWWLRDNPEEQRKLFGFVASEAQLAIATHAAIDLAIKATHRSTRGEPTPSEELPPPDQATDRATLQATDQATRLATLLATDQATLQATDQATRQATQRATLQAIDQATLQATDQATRLATQRATLQAIDQATDRATWQATERATARATEQATQRATDRATLQATWQATRQATEQATWLATDQATMQTTLLATDQATMQTTLLATEQATELSPLARFLVLCTRNFQYMRNGGNQWSGWVSYLSFFRHVVKLGLPEYEAFQHYEVAAIHGGPQFLHSKFWIVCDFPEFIKQDAENRPHCENGPYTRWKDGIELYYWHGTAVPKAWLENKEALDPALALTWPNIEQRRCLAEIIGWKKVLEKLNPRIIDTDIDPMIGTLLEVDLPDAPGERFLQVLCGTKREFIIPVQKEAKTALEANASTYGFDDLKVFRNYAART
jgi:hypothetical protein